MTDLSGIPEFTKKRLAGACIAGPILGLTLYAVIRIFHRWQYMPVLFFVVFLLGTGAFTAWAYYAGDG